ncbi:MAG TPA: hypothetical protein VFR80_15990, partial [Pyrinomonadaceae bacterium]|nr:hypothetical protein [Pyrinomonadaceae bacterium]
SILDMVILFTLLAPKDRVQKSDGEKFGLPPDVRQGLPCLSWLKPRGYALRLGFGRNSLRKSGAQTQGEAQKK